MTKKTDDLIQISTKVERFVDDALREGAGHGDIRRRVRAAVLAFMGAPIEHREAVYEYLAVCEARRRVPDIDEAYFILTEGHESDQA